MDRPLASVVIPAHNEERVLARCLGGLLAQAQPGEFDVVVVANACTDATAEVARAAGVRVIETATPGKANAIRLGDAGCAVFPRVYLDGDVGFDTASLRAVVSALTDGDALAASPAPRFDLTGVGWAARRAHTVHDLLMGPRRALAGVGVYALTEAGHARVFPLPDVISDDGYVHRSFTPAERLVVERAHSVIRPPASIRANLRRRVRLRAGNRQLDELGRPLPEGRLGLAQVRELLSGRTISLVDAACYLSLVAADKVTTRVRSARGREVSWGTDTGSRSAEREVSAG